jgi:hypothetical protein
MSADQKPVGVPHLEDPYAPIVYADVCLGGGAMTGDNITLTFATKFLDHHQNPPSTHTKTVLRLVIPRQQAEPMVGLLNQLITAMETSGGAPVAHSTIN